MTIGIHKRGWNVRTFKPENEMGSGAGGDQPDSNGATAQQAEPKFNDPFLRDYRDPPTDDDAEDPRFNGAGDNGDSDAELEELLKAMEPKDSEDGPPSGAPDPAANDAAARALGEELKQSLADLSLPDDFFDSDFSAGDPTSVRNAIQKATQFGAERAVALAMKPMKMITEQMYGLLQSEMDAKIKKAQGTQSAEGRLNAQVPALTTKAGKTVLTPFLKHMQENGQSEEHIIRALNRMAAQMNLNKPDQGQQGGGGGGGQSGVKSRAAITGTRALDEVFSSF